ncbi:glycine zipper 2TM domain-containing protein [Shewanella sp. AS1]|uniref:glycine zipper 2TM domain-containing protein n=1 Tax=Shewanella sp. AS1 TaxID=2907626 RepID=UPI001F171BE0|nr:glycine zipper 2TM domain-containing protein [Shewanella sp. AS1]MCE9678334.1 glycine zipper 2TM domain-containing protein [Shewanella sp. AS1]
MLKPSYSGFQGVFLVLIVLCGLGASTASTAAYDRNKALPVEKVIYGHVSSVRELTQSELQIDQNRGWKIFGGALLGGVVGHQFGGGSGRDVATVLGALLGAGAGSHSSRDRLRQMKLIELLINLDDGQQVMVLQDFDPGMRFNPDDRVRVIYFPGWVRVDLAM